MIFWIRKEADIKKIKVDKLIIGRFDGLHQGHKKLFIAAKNDITVLTFNFFKNKKELYTTQQKINLILNTFNVKNIVVFDLQNINLTSDQFINKILKKWNPQEIIVGSDFRFGMDHATWQKLIDNNFHLTVIKRSKINDCSTTKIKKLLSKAKLKKANKLLLSEFFYEGIVVHGKGLAKKLGYPTANFKIEKSWQLIPSGVYVTKTMLNNKIYQSLTFIGYPKTFNSQEEMKFETHLIDYNGKDFYDKKIKVIFLKKIDNVKKYKNIDLLIKGIAKQLDEARTFFQSK